MYDLLMEAGSVTLCLYGVFKVVNWVACRFVERSWTKRGFF